MHGLNTSLPLPCPWCTTDAHKSTGNHAQTNEKSPHRTNKLSQEKCVTAYLIMNTRQLGDLRKRRSQELTTNGMKRLVLTLKSFV